MYAALTKAFTNSVGIELVKERVDLANQALQALRATHPVKVDLLAKSFLDTTIDYKDASALFISNLCLDASITASLFEKLRKEIVPGTYVFCSKQPGSTEGFTHVATEQVEMSWTKTSSLYIFRKA